MVAIMDSSISDIYSSISELAAEHPRLAGAISIGTVLGTLWAYWRRPIIVVRLGKKAGSYAPVTVGLKNEQGQIIGRVQAKYLRLLIKNAGLTTIEDCSGQLLQVTRRVAGKRPDHFDAERYDFDWANYSTSDKRDVARWQSYHLDVATLVLLPSGLTQLFFGGFGRPMPTTLSDWLDAFPGRATYTYRLLIGAHNARPRKVPVEIEFDPEQADLSFVPFNTRYPWWRVWWWLRARWLRRNQTP